MKYGSLVFSILLSTTIPPALASGDIVPSEHSRNDKVESLAIAAADNDKPVVPETENKPDMKVRKPVIPERAKLGSIAIDNPLQARAMKHLDKGYNITNWLEQDRFDGFEYNEAFVKSLAKAGFESLRLPIDLDRYVKRRTGSGADMKLTVHEDLWLILDAFDQWTAAHGLSLTVDYHQYDKSLDFASDDSLRETVLLWGHVAEHFADHPRSDLYFELLNEPELSAESAPTKAQWTELANEMIAAIRAHDTTHTIIFGDVQWYGIGELSKRKPLADDNIVYAFHFYEPFIFTHQGASWADMSTTHDLPYPYDPEHWSPHYEDLGFSSSMESWILDDVREYHREANRVALFNRIAEAKRWGVENNVPVICNEFGVYHAKSRLEDRVRYYTDLTGIFEALQIPWQHWFMILREDGTVIPEYVEAFGLKRR